MNFNAILKRLVNYVVFAGAVLFAYYGLGAIAKRFSWGAVIVVLIAAAVIGVAAYKMGTISRDDANK